jgi:hypothetical protein
VPRKHCRDGRQTVWCPGATDPHSSPAASTVLKRTLREAGVLQALADICVASAAARHGTPELREGTGCGRDARRALLPASTAAVPQRGGGRWQRKPGAGFPCTDFPCTDFASLGDGNIAPPPTPGGWPCGSVLLYQGNLGHIGLATRRGVRSTRAVREFDATNWRGVCTTYRNLRAKSASPPRVRTGQSSDAGGALAGVQGRCGRRSGAWRRWSA